MLSTYKLAMKTIHTPSVAWQPLGVTELKLELFQSLIPKELLSSDLYDNSSLEGPTHLQGNCLYVTWLGVQVQNPFSQRAFVEYNYRQVF